MTFIDDGWLPGQLSPTPGYRPNAFDDVSPRRVSDDDNAANRNRPGSEPPRRDHDKIASLQRRLHAVALDPKHESPGGSNGAADRGYPDEHRG